MSEPWSGMNSAVGRDGEVRTLPLYLRKVCDRGNTAEVWVGLRGFKAFPKSEETVCTASGHNTG